MGRKLATCYAELEGLLRPGARLPDGLDLNYLFMKLCDLEESDVLAISLDQQHLCFDMVVRTGGGAKYKLLAWNTAGASLEVTFGALSLRGQLTDHSNRSILGELESISMVENVLTLEGDFGDIVIRNAVTSIVQLR